MIVDEMFLIRHLKRITLNRGPAGWRVVFPIEKHEFIAGCTTAAASGLQKKVGPC